MKNLLARTISLKKFISKVVILFCLSQFSNTLFAQLSGTKTVCKSGCDYSTVSSAVTAINSSGVGSGGVSFKISPGHIDTLTSAIVLTATGTSSNPISFIKNGSGANPKIVAYKGSTDKDGIFIFQGCDYVTVNGISLEENHKNSTPTNQMEWGFAFSKFYTGVLIDGCSNNVIKNCSITLSKTNTTQSTGSTLFKGSIGIYMSDNVFGAINTSFFDSTYASNRNEFLSNTISNVNLAFYLNGITSTPNSYDQGNVIGRLGQGNMITDFGGSSLSCYPIYANAQNYFLIEGNTIKGGDGTTGNLYGIFTEIGTNSTLRIKSNTITLTPVLSNPSAVINANQAGIWNVMGIEGTDNILEITGNIFKDCKYPNSNVAIYGVFNEANAFEVKIEHNLFLNNLYGSSSFTSLNSVTHIHHYYTAENKIAGSVLSISYNKVKNNTRILASSAGGGGFAYGIRVMGAAETVNIISDTVEGETYYRYNEDYEIYVSSLGTYNYNISNNILRGNAKTANIAVAGLHYGIFVTGNGSGIIKCFSNTISDFKTPSGFSGSIYGIYFSSGIGSGGEFKSNYIYSNKICDYAASSGDVYGIVNAKNRGYIFNNIIGNLTALTSNRTMAICGIDVSTGTHAFVNHNTVYIPNNSGGGTSFGSAAFYTGTSLKQTQFNNNIFINNAIPGTNGRSVAHWRNGVSVSNIETFSQGNIFYAGTPSTRNLIYYDGTLGCQTMNAYRYRVKIADMGSASENVVFSSTNGSSSKFLHLHDTTPSSAESNGYKTDFSQQDFDNEIRYGFNEYTGSGLGQDIGADEGNYKQPGTDVFPPSIYNVTAPLSCSSSSRTVAATLYDHGGIPLSGSNAPRLYYKKRKKGSFQSVAGTLAYGTSKVGYWTFDVNYSSIGGFSSADTIYAYIIVQDSASTPNISSFPGGVTASGVSSITSHPRDTFYFTYNVVAMGGVYTVGVSGSNYTTIKAAVNDLKARGVCGPVTINIKPGTYREKIILPAIKGSSRQNWITFKSSTDVANDVILIDSALTTTDTYIWRFDNAQNMTLRKVTLYMKGTYGWGVQLMGSGCRNLHIVACKMMVLDSTNGDTYYFKGIVNSNYNNHNILGDKMDSLLVDSNFFMRGSGGASFTGYDKTWAQENIVFSNNNLEYGVGNFRYISGLVIRNNVISTLYITGTGQFHTAAPALVSFNTILNGTTIEDSDHKPDFNGLFSNNICHGPVKNITSNYWKFYQNTVNCFNKYATSFTNERSQNIEVKNNILSMTFSFGDPSYLAFASDTKIPAGKIDNNIYWNPDGTNFIRNLDYYDINNFNTPGGGGINSRNLYPPFKGITDLRTTYSIDAVAPYLNIVPIDFSGTNRDTALTAIGAYEAFPDSNEVIIKSLFSPAFPMVSGQQTVSIKILNGGINPIISIKGSYQINNDSIITETFIFSGLNLGESKTLTFNKSFIQSHNCNRLRVWIAWPNGKQDINSYTDTLPSVDLNVPLNGVYTIGGSSPDFGTIGDAVNTLSCAGVIGPVTFNIRPGIYREKVSVPAIRGASNTNWITFQSSTKNAQDVIISDSIVDAFSSYHVWRFDNAKYMTLRNVTIRLRSKTNGWGIHIYGNKSKKIKIKSCHILMADSVGYNGSYIGLVVNSNLKEYTEGAKIDSLEIDSNYFRHGIFHIAIAGSNSDEIYVRNNIMYASGGFYYNLIGFRFQNNYIDANLVGLRLTKTFTFFSPSFLKNGIFMNRVGQANNSAASEITGNQIYHCFTVSIKGKNASGRWGLFANNMISSENNGVYFSESNYWAIYHNTINNYGSGIVYGFYFDYSDPNFNPNLIIKNNIFSVKNPLADKSSYAFYCKYITDTSNISHNVYWNPKGTNLLFFQSTNYTSSTFRKSPGGQKCYNINPLFHNDIYDLRIKDDCYGRGTPIFNIKDDIFKTKRSTSSPSIGAFEIIPLDYSASAARILSPQTSISTGTSYDLGVEIKNTGSKAITSLILSYSLNAKVISDTFISLNIAPCSVDTLFFKGAKSVTFMAGYNQIRCFTGLVNGNNDSYPIDDTTDVLGFCARLSGNFSINPVDTGATNFTSFRQAVSALYSCGVSGPVTISISPGAYFEKIIFDGLILGASKKNTITFNGGNPLTTKLIYDKSILYMNNSIVQFRGVKHIKLLNIGIENQHNLDIWGVHLKPNGKQGCDSILIKGCLISLNQDGIIGGTAGIVISASDIYHTAGNNANYLIMDSNTIRGGSYGIVCIGGGTGNLKNRKNIFSRNILSNQLNYGFLIQYQDSLEITQNKIINLGRKYNESNSYGIYAQNLDFFKINKNSFEQSDGIGIYLENTIGSNKRPSQVSNNMIQTGSSNSQGSIGIYSRFNTYLDIIDNSINILGSIGYPLYSYTSGTTYNNNRIANNNFVNLGQSPAIYFEGTNTDWQASLRLMNNNNYYSKGVTFRLGSNTTSSLSNWSTSAFIGSTNDTKSLSVDPEYSRISNLHTVTSNLDSMGLFVSGYSDDYDGEIRNTTKPDIGADEYDKPAINIGPVAFLKPTGSIDTGKTDVFIKIKNFGRTTITSATVSYKIGKKGTPKSIAWTGNLTYLESDTVRFNGANQYLVQMNVLDTLYFYTESPNGLKDGYTYNDTLWNCLCGMLKGTFTLGGQPSQTNFRTWNDASVRLTQCDIAESVIINVAPGIYNERVVFNMVPGATGNKKIMFQSANGNPKSSILQYCDPYNLFPENYVLKLNGAKNYVFKNLTIQAAGVYQYDLGIAVLLDSDSKNYSDSNVFYNNTIRGLQEVLDPSEGYSCIYSRSTYNKNNQFIRNTIENGSYGIYYNGLSGYINTLDFNKGVLIDSNIFRKQFYCGIFAQGLDNPDISYNDVLMNSSYNSKMGIKVNSTVMGGRITNNRIEVAYDGFTCLQVGQPNNSGYDPYSKSARLNISNNSLSFLGTLSKTRNALSVENAIARTDIYHNSLYVTGYSNGAYFSSYSNDTGVRIVNNNFITETGVPALFMGYDSAYKRVDFNNYFNITSGGILAQVLNTKYYSLVTLDGILYKSPNSDSNSISINPKYTRSSNLNVLNPLIAGTGSPVGVFTDINNHFRDLSAPTIGAYEIPGDLRVTEILDAEVKCFDDRPVTFKFKVKNKGITNVTQFYLSYKIGLGSIKTDTVNYSLKAGDSVILAHTKLHVFEKYGTHRIGAFTNYISDLYTDDTLKKSILTLPLPRPSFTYSDTCGIGRMKFKSTSTIDSGTVIKNLWFFGETNGDEGDTISHSYDLKDTFYTVKLVSTSNEGCIDSIRRQVHMLSPLESGDASNHQTICYNSVPLMLLVNSATGSVAPYSYQWQYSYDSINFTDIAGADSLYFQPDSLKSTQYYRLSVTASSGCGPEFSDTINVIVNLDLNAGNIGSPQTICYNGIGSAITFNTRPTGAFGTYSYQWQRSSDSITWSDLIGQKDSIYTPDSLTNATYFRVVVSSSSCLSKYTNGVKVNLFSPIAGGTIGNGQTICGGNSPSTFTETSAPSGGPGNYNYKWQYSVDSINWKPIFGANTKDYSATKLYQTTWFRRLAENTGCPSGVSNVLKVLTLPKPNLAFNVNIHCLNDTMPLTNSSTISSGSLTYLWNFGDGTSSSADTPQKVYTSMGSFDVKLIGTSNLGCKDSLTKSVIVATVPKALFNYTYKCEGDSVLFNDETFYSCVSTSGLSIYWDFGDGSTSTVQNARHHYASSGNYNVKLKISLPGGYSDSITRGVDFNMRSNPDFSTSNQCFPTFITITNNSSNFSNLNWTFGDSTKDTITTLSFKKGYTSPGNYSIKLVSTSAVGCKDSLIKTVSVLSKPDANFNVSNTCLGNSSNFKSISNSAVSYIWNFGDGDTSGKENPVHTYASTGNYKITLRAISSNGCKDSSSNNITIYPNPKASFTNSNVCKGFATKFTNTSTGANSFKWNFGNGDSSITANPSYTYPNAGAYKVILTAITNHGCSQSYTDSHKVYESPIAAFTADNVCIGKTTIFNNSSSGNILNRWNFGDGTNSSSGQPTKTFSAPGNYKVKLNVTNNFGCKDSFTKSVSVFSKPVPNFSATNQCFGFSVSFNNQSSGANSYTWDFGNTFTSSSDSPNYNYPSSGTYNVKLISQNASGCKDSIIKSLTIYPKPSAGFNISNNSQCLNSNIFILTNTTSISSGSKKFEWNFGDTQKDTSTNPKKTYTSFGNYNIKLVSTSNFGCKDSIIKSVAVNPNPTATFTIDNSSQCLNINSFRFTNNSTIASGKFSSKWDLGDNTTDTSMNVTAKSYSSSKTYSVKLLINSAFNCKDSVTKTVTVNPMPNVGYTIQNNAQCLRGNSFKFTNTSSISSGTLTYKWTFDNGSTTTTNPTWSYTNHGTYGVKLTVKSNNGCSDSVSKSVTVYPQITPAFTVANGDQCFKNNSFSFTNSSTIPSGSFTSKWDFGDNTFDTSKHVTTKQYSLNIERLYAVKLVLTSGFGCKDSITKNAAYVRINPVAGFSISKMAQCLRGHNFILTNTTTYASKYLWDFGDSQSSNATSPVKIYTNSGSYKITLFVTNTGNGCLDTINHTVTVHPQSKANFSINDNTQCFRDNLFNFDNLTTIDKHDTIFQYIWNFNEGPEVFLKSPSFSYQKAGKYKVKLISVTSKGCLDSISLPIVIHPQSSLAFKINDTAQCNSIDTFYFSNLSKLSKIEKSDTIKLYQWNFNEGIGSFLQSPLYSYKNPGFYRVSLKTQTDKGCIDSLSHTLVVHPQANIAFNINDTAQCNSIDTFRFINLTTIDKIEKSDTVYSYRWNFREGVSNNSISPEYSYTNSGFYNVTLTSESDKGCIDSMIKSLIVHPQVNLIFSINDTDQCNSVDTFRFSNLSMLNKIESTDTINTYKWNFREGTGSELKSSQYSYSKPGSYTVTLTTTTNKGCVDSLIHALTVHPQANIGFKINDTAQCISGNLFLLEDTSTITTGRISRSWTFGDDSTGNISPVSHSYLDDGKYYIKLALLSDKGCVDSIIKKVIVHPKPNVNFDVNDSIQCFQMNNFMFKNTSTIDSGNLLYYWSFGDGKNSSKIDTSHQYTTMSNFRVKLIATSIFGCQDSVSHKIRINSNPTIPSIIQKGIYLETDADTGIQWYFANDLIPNENYKLLPAKESGIYKLVVYNKFGCPQESDTFSYTYNGSKDLGVLIFPNPNNGNFSITSLTPLDKIEIIDLNGKVLFLKTYEQGTMLESFNIDVSRADYLIRVSAGKKNETIKIKVLK